MAEPSRSKPRKAPAKKRAAKATRVATAVVDLLDAPATGADRMSALPERAEQLSGGLDTSVFTNAWADYWAKLLNSPARQAALVQQVMELANDTLAFAQRAAEQAVSPHEGAAVADPRYADPAWAQYPFNLLARAHQNFTAYAHEATRDVPGLDAKNRALVDFSLRLMGDATSPANNLATNPQLLAQTIAENGANLQRGWQHLLEDMDRQQKGLPAAGTEQFVVGEHVACTPGQVVYRNALIELIQYSPTTPKVHRAPVRRDSGPGRGGWKFGSGRHARPRHVEGSFEHLGGRQIRELNCTDLWLQRNRLRCELQIYVQGATRHEQRQRQILNGCDAVVTDEPNGVVWG